MGEAIAKIADAASWKLRTLLRTTRFFDVIEMVNLYKSRVLGYIECKTAAIYHAARSELQRIDRVQNAFLRNAGISEMEAICFFRLAPLCSRRDMALLGLIHRTVLGHGPEQFKKFIRPARTCNHMGRESERRHNRQLETHRVGKYMEIVGNSMLGLIDVYNLLPSQIVAMETVQKFQGQLQIQLIEAAKRNEPNWRDLYSPRLAIYAHPLRKHVRPGNEKEAVLATTNVNEKAKCISGWLSFAQ